MATLMSRSSIIRFVSARFFAALTADISQ